MAKSRYEYVRAFEEPDALLPSHWPVVRVDGKNFHKFCTIHEMEKPNDERLLKLMNFAALKVMEQLEDIVISYGQSDEYSFVFREKTKTYNRRRCKLSSTVVSIFSSAFVFHWNDFFKQDDKKLQYPPSFDSRVIPYPKEQILKDYLSWRQVDCHINNLYNTCFWYLVQSGRTPKEAEKDLKGTVSKDKHELLFSQFNTNYNNLPQLVRKGTIIVRNNTKQHKKTQERAGGKREVPNDVTTLSGVDDVVTPTFSILNEDLIGKKFWEERSYLLEN